MANKSGGWQWIINVFILVIGMAISYGASRGATDTRLARCEKDISEIEEKINSIYNNSISMNEKLGILIGMHKRGDK